MKQSLLILNVVFTLAVAAQPRKKAKMAPLYAPAYYVSMRGDTVRGNVQINPEDPLQFYHQFAFRIGSARKPRVINPQKAKAYGFDNRDFVMVEVDRKKLYVERLVSGRLKFYEYRFNGKINGYPAVESTYYVKDTGADDQELKEIKEVSQKFYKKVLKPYMKDQPMIWSDLDKFNFDRKNVIQAIAEFNGYYKPVSN
jgi:hypothetical protein